MRHNIDQRRAAAIHEAAHAVIAVQGGNWIRNRGVTIEENGDGLCDIRPRAVPQEADWMRGEYWEPYRSRAVAEIHTCLAGPLAEVRYTIGGYPSIRSEDSVTGELSEDFQDAYGLIDVLHPDADPDLMLDFFEGETYRLLRKRKTWAAIKRLADRLYGTGYVSGDDVVQVIENSIPTTGL
jgi:hypothetical protein